MPKYRRRTPQRLSQVPSSFTLGDKKHPLALMDNYTDMTLVNFNLAYPQMVEKSKASIATKVVTAFIGSEAAGVGVGAAASAMGAEEGLAALLGLGAKLIGAATAGAVIKKTTRPDLRSWRINYDHLEMSRVHLPAGEYTFSFQAKAGVKTLNPLAETVIIEAGKSTFSSAPFCQ